MPESIDAWWSRRQRSKGTPVPYPVGTYRDDWAPFPVLVHQYHPDLNREITLTQVPPAADVYLTWQCDTGHVFVATPAEQRSRPGGGKRRRSVWCPVCSELAAPRRAPKPFAGPAVPPDSVAPAEGAAPGESGSALGQTQAPGRGPSHEPGAGRERQVPVRRGVGGTATPAPHRRGHGRRGHDQPVAGIVRLATVPFGVPPLPAPTSGSGVRAAHPEPPSMTGWTVAVAQDPRAAAGSGRDGADETGAHGTAAAAAIGADGAAATSAAAAAATTTTHAMAAAPPLRSEDVRTDPRHRAGDPFHSARAPRTASAAEAELRHRLAERFELDLSPERANAIAVTRPFFGRTEVWPDIVIAELRVAIEYDTVGRFGLEHVGPREDTDRRKDRMLRAVDWEVVRVRCGRLQPIGPFDVAASGVTNKLVDALVDRLREIRGDLIVNAYLRPL